MRRALQCPVRLATAAVCADVALPHIVAGSSSSLRPAPVLAPAPLAARRFSRVAQAYGKMTPWAGFVSEDIESRETSEELGGSQRRGVFARRDLRYDKEIMNLPAVTYYVGDGDSRQQSKELTKWVLAKAVKERDAESKPWTAYIHRRLQSMQTGGPMVFRREEEVTKFLADVPGDANCLVHDEVLTTFEVQRLAQQIEFNRWDLEYNGLQGVALFPEASMFNHSCEPNTVITTRMNLKKEFVLEARILQPLKRGEELFVNYLPDNNLPLSRFGMAMRKRWGFECSCPVCKSRAVTAVGFIFFFIIIPMLIPVRYYLFNRQNKNARKAGYI